MKNQQPTHTRGGARPNSGPKPNIEKNLILYDIALSFNVGLDRARRLLAGWRNQPELVIGESDIANCASLRRVKTPAHISPLSGKAILSGGKNWG